MNAVANAIQSENLSGTAAEIAKAFTQSVSLPYVTERWTYDGVAELFGVMAAEGLGNAIRGAGMVTAAIVYATKGFDLSLDETQQNLTEIGAKLPQLAPVCEALKAIGRPTSPRWQRAGLDAAPDEAACSLALRQIIAQQWCANALNEVFPSAISDGKTPAEIVTMLQETL